MEKKIIDRHGVESAQQSPSSVDRSRKPRSKPRPSRRPTVEIRRSQERQNESVKSDQKKTRANAVKHGVFSLSPTIPWENPEEFKELHSALSEEWKPSGPSEGEAVFALADLYWRKYRLRRFIRAKLEANSHDPSNPSFNEYRGLAEFGCYICSKPETAFEAHASRRLRPETISYLKQKFPRENYESVSEWAEAVGTEIVSVLLPATPNANEPQDDPEIEQMRERTIECQLSGAIARAMPFFEHELDQLERLDGMIGRKVKHLIQLKAMKQMLFPTSIEQKDELPNVAAH